MVSAREIVGKRIIAFNPGSYASRGERGNTTIHEPTITLEDGSFLYFVTEENHNGESYGVFVGRSRQRDRDA